MIREGIAAIAGLVKKTDLFVFQHQHQVNLAFILVAAIALLGIVRVGFYLKPSEVNNFLPTVLATLERPHER